MTAETEDPIKLHKEGNVLYETGKYKESAEKFLRSAELYKKKNNFFDASNMTFKAGECSFMLEEFEAAIPLFEESAELSFEKGFDRFGVSALEYILDCYRALKKGKSRNAVKLEKRIKEIKVKLASQF